MIHPPQERTPRVLAVGRTQAEELGPCDALYTHEFEGSYWSEIETERQNEDGTFRYEKWSYYGWGPFDTRTEARAFALKRHEEQITKESSYREWRELAEHVNLRAARRLCDFLQEKLAGPLPDGDWDALYDLWYRLHTQILEAEQCIHTYCFLPAQARYPAPGAHLGGLATALQYATTTLRVKGYLPQEGAA